MDLRLAAGVIVVAASQKPGAQMRTVKSLADVQIILRDVLNRLDLFDSKARDQKGLQIKNAGDATDDADLVTLRQLNSTVTSAVAKKLANNTNKSNTTTTPVTPVVVIPPPGSVTYTVVQNSLGTLSVKDVGISGSTDITGIIWQLLLVDELQADKNTGCWVTLTNPVGAGPEIQTITVTPNPAQTSLLQFQLLDYILFNDSGNYEWAQIVGYQGNTWQISRVGPDRFNAPLTAHPVGTQVFCGELREMPQAAPPVQETIQFDMICPSVIVGAVLGTAYNTITGTTTVTNLATATLPGLRTLSGGDFTFQKSGTIVAAAGVNLGINKPVRYNLPLRFGFATLGSPSIGANAVFNIRRSSDLGITWVTLLTVTILAGQFINYPFPGDPPQGIANWPFFTLGQQDCLNVSCETIGTGAADLTVEIYT